MSFLGTLKKYSFFIIVSFTFTAFMSYAANNDQRLNEKADTGNPDKKNKKKKKKGIGSVSKKLKKAAKAPMKQAKKMVKSVSKLAPKKEKQKKKAALASLPVLAKAASPKTPQALPKPLPKPAKVQATVKAYDPYDQTGLPSITIDPPGPSYDYHPNLPMVLFMPPKGIDAPTLLDDKPSPDLQ